MLFAMKMVDTSEQSCPQRRTTTNPWSHLLACHLREAAEDRGNTDERSGVSRAELTELPELAELAEQRQVYKLVWVLHECDVRQPVKLIKCK